MERRPSPAFLSRRLASIAMKIEASDSPSLSAVHGELRRVVSVLTRESRIRELAAEMVRVAAEDVDASLWDTDEAMDVKSAWKAGQEVNDDPKKLALALKSLKSDVDSFIDELLRDPSSASKPAPNEDDVFTSAPARSEIGKKPVPPAKPTPPGPPPKR